MNPRTLRRSDRLVREAFKRSLSRSQSKRVAFRVWPEEGRHMAESMAAITQAIDKVARSFHGLSHAFTDILLSFNDAGVSFSMMGVDSEQHEAQR